MGDLTVYNDEKSGTAPNDLNNYNGKAFNTAPNDLNDHHNKASGYAPDDLNNISEAVQRAEEIKASIEKSTAERAAMVQEMVNQKEKSPSLIKSIIERLNAK